MTRDYFWKPLAYISPQQDAYLIHPGSSMAPIKLSAGWAWHWPVLSVIRVVDQPTTEYVLSAQTDLASSLAQLCEPVVGVSRDHHLFVVEGCLTVLVGQPAESTVPRYIKYSPTKLHRHTQSLIRQSVRKALSEYSAKQLDGQVFSPIQSHIQADLNFHLNKIDLQVDDTTIRSISPYRRKGSAKAAETKD